MASGLCGIQSSFSEFCRLGSAFGLALDCGRLQEACERVEFAAIDSRLTDRQRCDPETDLIYMRARYYDPATAQFLSVDPLVAVTGSAYGYVDGNPVNFTDPLGLYPRGGFRSQG